jgi:hypothetical protein
MKRFWRQRSRSRAPGEPWALKPWADLSVAADTGEHRLEDALRPLVAQCPLVEVGAERPGAPSSPTAELVEDGSQARHGHQSADERRLNQLGEPLWGGHGTDVEQRTRRGGGGNASSGAPHAFAEIARSVQDRPGDLGAVGSGNRELDRRRRVVEPPEPGRRTM